MPPDVRKRFALPLRTGTDLGCAQKLGAARRDINLPEGRRPSAHQTAQPIGVNLCPQTSRRVKLKLGNLVLRRRCGQHVHRERGEPVFALVTAAGDVRKRGLRVCGG